CLTVLVSHLTRQLHALFLVLYGLTGIGLDDRIPHLTKIEDQGTLVSHLSRQLEGFAYVFHRGGFVRLPHRDPSQLAKYFCQQAKVSSRPRFLEGWLQDLHRLHIMSPD